MACWSASDMSMQEASIRPGEAGSVDCQVDHSRYTSETTPRKRALSRDLLGDRLRNWLQQ